MTYDLTLRNGTVVRDAGVDVTDIGVRNGKIVEIGGISAGMAAEEIDATGLHIFPGLIDTQVHFREPGMEHKEDLESGTRAAIAGGVTAIFEMPNTNPTTTSQEALEDKLRRAEGRAWCDHAFFVGAATDNISELAGLEALPGTPGIKVFVGSSTGSLLVPDDDHLRQVFQQGRFRTPIHSEDHPRLESRKGLLSEHPHAREHPFLRDAECARLATERVLRLSAETGRAVHILHLSTADEIPMIEAAKPGGTTVEITPQHLWFAAPECYEELGTLAQMNPPLRDASHRDALRAALQRGFFDVIGSDHAPHTLEEKALPYPKSPSGMPGVQTILPVMITLNLISLSELAKLTSYGARRIYGIQGKGGIEIGLDADFALVDLDRMAAIGDGSSLTKIQSKCGWSPYAGVPLKGWAVKTLLRGRLVMDEGELLGPPSGEVVRFNR